MSTARRRFGPGGPHKAGRGLVKIALSSNACVPVRLPQARATHRARPSRPSQRWTARAHAGRPGRVRCAGHGRRARTLRRFGLVPRPSRIHAERRGRRSCAARSPTSGSLRPATAKRGFLIRPPIPAHHMTASPGVALGASGLYDPGGLDPTTMSWPTPMTSSVAFGRGTRSHFTVANSAAVDGSATTFACAVGSDGLKCTERQLCGHGRWRGGDLVPPRPSVVRSPSAVRP